MRRASLRASDETERSGGCGHRAKLSLECVYERVRVRGKQAVRKILRRISVGREVKRWKVVRAG